jgi:hypothetical protein
MPFAVYRRNLPSLLGIYPGPGPERVVRSEVAKHYHLEPTDMDIIAVSQEQADTLRQAIEDQAEKRGVLVP